MKNNFHIWRLAASETASLTHRTSLYGLLRFSLLPCHASKSEGYFSTGHKRQNLSAFTLIELLLGVTIFTVILGTLFGVLVAIQKANITRDNYAVVSQAARFSYEPVVRALKNADAVATTWNITTGCHDFRGFFLQDTNGNTVTGNFSAPGSYSSMEVLTQGGGKQLVTISAEKTFDIRSAVPTGPKYEWVKRVFKIDYNKKPDPDTGALNYAVIETVYKMGNPKYQWPLSLRVPSASCKASTDIPNADWVQDSERALTPAKANIREFSVRLASPVLDKPLPSSITSPFATIEIIAEYNRYTSNKSKNPPPVALRSTITPTFNYGAVNEPDAY